MSNKRNESTGQVARSDDAERLARGIAERAYVDASDIALIRSPKERREAYTRWETKLREDILLAIQARAAGDATATTPGDGESGDLRRRVAALREALQETAAWLEACENDYLDALPGCLARGAEQIRALLAADATPPQSPETTRGKLFWPTDPQWPCPTCGACAGGGNENLSGGDEQIERMISRMIASDYHGDNWHADFRDDVLAIVRVARGVARSDAVERAAEELRDAIYEYGRAASNAAHDLSGAAERREAVEAKRDAIAKVDALLSAARAAEGDTDAVPRNDAGEQMSVQTPVAKDSPLWLAWAAYKATEEFANTRRWALDSEHVEGSLWAAFDAGFRAAKDQSHHTQCASVLDPQRSCDCYHGAGASRETPGGSGEGAPDGAADAELLTAIRAKLEGRRDEDSAGHYDLLRDVYDALVLRAQHTKNPVPPPPSAVPSGVPGDEGVKCVVCGRWHSGVNVNDSPTTHCEACDPVIAVRRATPNEVLTKDELVVARETTRGEPTDVRALALRLIEATGGDPDAARSAVSYAWHAGARGGSEDAAPDGADWRAGLGTPVGDDGKLWIGVSADDQQNRGADVTPIGGEAENRAVAGHGELATMVGAFEPPASGGRNDSGEIRKGDTPPSAITAPASRLPVENRDSGITPFLSLGELIDETLNYQRVVDAVEWHRQMDGARLLRRVWRTAVEVFCEVSELRRALAKTHSPSVPTTAPTPEPCRIYEYDGAWKCYAHNRVWGAITGAGEPCPGWNESAGLSPRSNQESE